MIKNFIQLRSLAKKNPKKVAVASAEDEHVLKAVIWAKKIKIADFILIGHEKQIRALINQLGGWENDFQIENASTFEEAADKAALLAATGKANAIMKGLLPSPIFLKAVLNESIALKKPGEILTHVAVMKVPGWPVFIATDCAVNIAPALKDKKMIVQNAIYSAHRLGLKKPNVAIVTASETVNKKMQDTIDADELVKMAEKGEFGNAVVGGPFALDNAISKEAAEIKNIKHPGAGEANILVFPDLTCANVFYKSLIFYGKAQSAGVILGAKAPVILVSRSDSEKSKLNSIALACVLS